MTISDVEYLTGMTRANIRYYEEQGFISPARESNGYRDYSKNDIEILKKIKLLRTLHMSLEEIKSLYNGEANLIDALDKHIEKLKKDKTVLETSERICKSMRYDGVSFNTFDAQIYLDKLTEVFETPVKELETDTAIMAPYPIRRFLARLFDWHLYLVLWQFILYLFGIHLFDRSYYELFFVDFFLIPFLFMLFLEPLLISIFGTTFGKGILGLHVTNNTSQHLSYYEAFTRFLSIIFAPIKEQRFLLYFFYLQYVKCAGGETLSWEYDSKQTLKDDRTWRNIAFGISCLLLLISAYLVIGRPYYPTDVANKGDITIREFSENYNELLPHNSYHYLSSVGKWVDDTPSGTVIVNINGNKDIYPSYRYITENNSHGSYNSNDIMKGMTFTAEQENVAIPDSCLDDIKRAMTAFLKAQEAYDDNPKELDNILNSIPAYESFEHTVYGVTVSCTVTYSGYTHLANNSLVQSDNSAETYFKLEFSMTKN